VSPSERGRLLWKLADLIERHAEEFATLESLDNGKPLTVARVADVPLTIDMFRYMAGWATKITRSPERPSRFRSRANISRSRCASRLAWSARSFRGISRC
jgi:acyl-CoA reductase-like NAD-dependent aldehyde dehydrogenase